MTSVPATTRPSAAAAAAARGFGEGAILTPANLLTLARIFATPPFLWLLAVRPASWATWLAWAVLCGTDLVDGKLARRQGATRSGAFLDPLADKVLVLGGFAVLIAIGRTWWLPVGVIAAREVAMSLYRSWIGRRGVSVPASKAAKVKTWSQCVAAGLFMFPPAADVRLVTSGVLWLSVALTVVTGLMYALDGRKLLRRPSV